MSALTDGADAFGSIVNGIGSLFGTGSNEQGAFEKEGSQITNSTLNSFRNTSGLQTEQLQLEDAAVQQIIRDVLGGPDGLAAIFAGEQNAGIFNSSVAAEAAGDLASKLVGEIAKITGKNVKTADEDVEETQNQTQTVDETSRGSNEVKSEDEGVLSGIGDFFGF